MNDLPWSVVRKDTGETIAMFANQWDAAGFRNSLIHGYEVRPTLSRTCKTCKWWRVRGDYHGNCEGTVYTRDLTSADFGCNGWETKDATQK